MTSPNHIIVSLDWAKRLRDAGWKDFSYYQWVRRGNFWSPVENSEWIRRFMEDDGSIHGADEYMPAPTAEEILRRLPTQVKARPPKHFTHDRYRVHIGHNTVGADNERGYKDSWGVHLRRRKAPKILPGSTFWDDSLANAAAAMYCYLAKQKLLPSA